MALGWRRPVVSSAHRLDDIPEVRTVDIVDILVAGDLHYRPISISI